MNNIIGSTTSYILVQRNTETVDSEQTLFYNEYNMTLTPVQSQDLHTATKFEDLSQAQAIVGLQNQMAIIFGRPFEYFVVKEETARTIVE